MIREILTSQPQQTLQHINPSHQDEPFQSPVESQKRGTVIALEKEKDTPQLSHALQEFVKHIANPLVDKGWNLHLKFGKGGPKRAVCTRLFPMGAHS